MKHDLEKIILTLTPRFKLWLSSPDAEGVFGDGKWRLLRAIERERSLRAAAERLDISYRKAWGDLKKAEKYLKVELVERRRGGLEGGTTRLTKEGRRWVGAYSRFRRAVNKAASQAFADSILELIE